MKLPSYTPHRDREQRIPGAITAIRAILSLELYPAHKKGRTHTEPVDTIAMRIDSVAQHATLIL